MLVANALRRHVLSLSNEPIEVRRWSEGFTSIDTVAIQPPPAKAANDPSVNRLRAADYVLLAAGTPWDEYEAQNQRHKDISYALRKAYDIRQVIVAVADYLQAHAKDRDDDIISALTSKGLEVNKTRITDSKKYLKMDSNEHDLWRKESKPPQLADLPLYESVYH